MQLCCIPLRDLRYLRENNTEEDSIYIAQTKPQCLPQITLIIAGKPQNNKTALTSPNCLSLRYNAACCIPLRDLRYLRENTRKRTQTIRTEETPMSPADLADDADKPQNNNNQTVFLCEIMRLCCIRLRHLRYLRENIHMRVLNQTTQKKPQCLSQITQIIADKPQNRKTALTSPICLSLRYNAALLHSSAGSALSAGEYTQENSINCTKKPQCLPQISQIYADETHNHKTA